MLLILALCIVCHLSAAFIRIPAESYHFARAKLMSQEQQISIGGQLTLNADEIKVDYFLRKLKTVEVSN